MSVDSSGVEANAESGDLTLFEQRPVAISADGSVVAFESAATNLITGDTNGLVDLFIHERSSGLTERINVSSAGMEANGESHAPVMTPDGLVVVFWSRAASLVGGDLNGVADVFLRDRAAGTTERISVLANGAEANGGSYRATISADGRFVAFESDASNLVAGDSNHSTDIFVKDRATGAVERVSVSSAGGQANPGGSFDPSISADARFVAFSARATNLVGGDTNDAYDVFVRDRSALTTERVSVDSSGAQGNLTSWHPALSSDGSVVVFESSSTNLVAGDQNGAMDIFVHERVSGVTERVSIDSAGYEANGSSNDGAINSDGRFVAYTSGATNLVTGDENVATDVFLHDRQAGTTRLVSIDCAWSPGDDRSGNAALPDDGSVVAFSSAADDIADGDANGVVDVLVFDPTLPPILAGWSNYGSGFAGTLGIPTITASANPVFGATIDVDVSSSSVGATSALLLVGVQPASIPTSAGGTLLVAPLVFDSFALPPSGATFTATIPSDPKLCGTSAFAQALEFDPGAAHGISFTPGLELDFGH